ncbi:MAG: T9SS type A sorting domain-containing protein, partial [Cytophagales bacterium]
FSIINNGRLGFSNIGGPRGSGYRRNNTNLVYEGGLIIASNKGNLSDCIRIQNTQKADFMQTDFLRFSNAGYADKLITNRYTDTGRFKLGIDIRQNVFAYNGEANNNYVIVEYVLTNNTDSVYDKIHAGIFFDWDLPAIGTNDNFFFAKNRSFWDSERNMGVAFNTLTNGMYSAIKILSPNVSPIFRSIDINTLGTTFTDGLKYTFMNAGISNAQAGYNQSLGTDIAHLIGGTFDNFKPGERRTLALALIASTDLASVQQISNVAMNRYRSARTSPTPRVSVVNACVKQSTAIQPSNGQLFGFYKDFPLGQNPDFVGQRLTFDSLSSDTILFVTGKDSIFESNAVMARIRVNEFIGDFSYASLPFNGRYYFTSNTPNVVSWDWQFDTLGTDSGKYVEFDFPFNGTYDVKAILVNNIGCSDTITRKITVSNFITTLLEGIMGYLKVYPNPAKEYLIVEIPDNSPGNYLTIDNIIGVRVIEQKNLVMGENRIDLSGQPNGIYFLNLFLQGRLTKIKFLISK